MDDDSGDCSPKTLRFNRHACFWDLLAGGPQPAGGCGGEPFSYFTQFPEEYFRVGPAAVLSGDAEAAAAAAGLQGGHAPGGVYAGEADGSGDEAEAAAAATATETQNGSWAAAQGAGTENWRSNPRVVEGAAAPSGRPSPVDAAAQDSVRRMVLMTRERSRLLAEGGAVEVLLPIKAADGYGSGLSSAGRRRKAVPGWPRQVTGFDRRRGAR